MPLIYWINDWNYILRNVIFKDELLKSLMKIPDGTGIILFIDRYFIRAGYTNTLLKDLTVRIVYSDILPALTTNPNVKKSLITFDIYVKQTDLHNVGNDRLIMRTQLIANRLIHLLTKQKRINGYRFWHVGDYDLGTRTIGYARYSVSFGYMKVI